MAKTKDSKEGWGGNRTGAGRPPLEKERKVVYNFALHREVSDLLDKIAKKLGLSRSGALEVIIRDYRK